MAESTCVAVFTRAPELGRVKTRLAQDIGAAAALETHLQLLSHTLDQVAVQDGWDAELWVAGDPSSVPARGLPVRIQPQGDLGDRMLAAIETITARGQRALVIGSDCPVLSSTYLIDAAAALDDCDLVLGPSEDGGYALVGMHRAHPELFVDMTWSVPEVCSETQHRAARLGLSVVLLPELWDVDTIDDWRRWQAG